MKKLFLLCMSLLTISNSFSMQRVGLQGLQVIVPQVMAIAASMPIAQQFRGYASTPSSLYSSSQMAYNNSGRAIKSALQSSLVDHQGEVKHYPFASRTRNAFGSTPVCLMSYTRAEQVLGLRGTGWKNKDLKKKYREAVKKYHPDINHDPSATEKFREIKEAYDILSGNASASSNSQDDFKDDFKSGNYQGVFQGFWRNAKSEYSKNSYMWNTLGFGFAGYLTAIYLLIELISWGAETRYYSNKDYKSIVKQRSLFRRLRGITFNDQQKDFLKGLVDYQFEALFLHMIQWNMDSMVKEMIKIDRVDKSYLEKGLYLIIRKYKPAHAADLIDAFPQDIKLSLSKCIGKNGMHEELESQYSNIKYLVNTGRLNLQDYWLPMYSLMNVAIAKSDLFLIEKLYNESNLLEDTIVDRLLDRVEQFGWPHDINNTPIVSMDVESEAQDLLAYSKRSFFAEAVRNVENKQFQKAIIDRVDNSNKYSYVKRLLTKELS